MDTLRTLQTLSIALIPALALTGCPPEAPAPADDKAERVDWFGSVDDFSISWHPDESEFEDIVEVVDAYQSDVPEDIAGSLGELSREQLRAVVSYTWNQDVVEYSGESAQEMGVELTLGLVEVPYEDFIAIMPPEFWGPNLAHYLGGELLRMPGVDGGQYERMVLSAFPGLDYDPVNNDMTKAEIVVRDEDHAKVYWRVYHSDNDTTDADVGSVSFGRYDDDSTLVMFHSAHVIRGLGGLIPLLPSDGWIIEDTMFDAVSDMFTDFVLGYQAHVEAQYRAGFGDEYGGASYSDTVEEDEWHHYGPFSLHEGQSLLATLSGTNDADLYVRTGDQPTLDDYDCRPWASDSYETCELSSPDPIYIAVHGFQESRYTLDLLW